MTQNKPIVLLAIESSCDDTSAAVMRDGILLSNVTASQAVHEQYGGVVPELASRAHQQHIVPVVDAALKQAGVEKSDLSAVAVTLGPGLMGSLLVGVSFAKGLAAALGIPLIEVNHLHGHILAHFIHTADEVHDDPPTPSSVCSSAAATRKSYVSTHTMISKSWDKPSTTRQAKPSTSVRK